MWCKAEFSASLVLPHDPSEIILICWFGAKETFVINKVENSCAACGNCDFSFSLNNYFFHLFEIEIFVTL